MSRAITQGIDYTSKDYEAFRSMMIKNLQIKMPEYTDIRQSDAGIVILELLAQGLDIISLYQDIIANETFLVTEEQRSNALKWCSMLGYIPRTATPARFKQVFKLSAVQQIDTTIPQGTVVKTLGSATEPEISFETETDLVIPAGKLGDEKDSEGNYLYTVDIIQGISVKDELLGTSNGTANQTFKLNYTPAIANSVSVFVNEGSGFEGWVHVDSFIDSSSTSKDFTVSVSDNDETVITFGDNVFGKIPHKYTNGIYCTYRVGGGEDGNVGANKINVLGTNLALVSETFNPSTCFEMGQDKETLEEIKTNAPLAYRNLWGALTLEDFAGVLKINFPEIQFATAKIDPEDIDSLYIYLYLKDGMELTEELKEKYLKYFDENEGGRKIVGAKTLTLKYANFIPVDFSCSLVVKDRYSKSKVEGDIKSFLEYKLKKGNWGFNTELSYSELSSLLQIPSYGVAGIKSFKFIADKDVLTPNVGDIYCFNSVSFTTTGGI